MKQIPILIPSYEPDERLIKFIDELDQNNIFPIIIVDDGSGKLYQDIFNKVETIIRKHDGVLLHHDVNKGKGRALKTGFKYIIDNLKDAIGCVTADSDGQHSVNCIKSVKEKLQDYPNDLVLGVREFDIEGIPWTSRMGNKITEKVFAYLSGVHVSDTQTGLRGIPLKFMNELLDIKGERFEFEMRMLIEAADNYPIKEVPIKTIYDSETNHQTHFNPLKDSIKIYKILGERFLKFLFSSLSSSVVDLVLFSIFCLIFKKSIALYYVTISTVLARVFSAIYNYLINYKFVFNSKNKIVTSISKYALLAVIQMICSATLLTLAVYLFPNIKELILKMIVDIFLFFISYKIQQKFVF